MPTDRDLHRGFNRVASGIEPDVQRHLHQTLRHGRRRLRVHRTVVAASVVATVLLIVVAGPAALRWIRETGPVPGGVPIPTATASPDGGPIAGSYSMVLPDAAGVIRDESMSGPWTLRLQSDGTVLLTAPDAFDASTTGIVFSLTGNQFRTNAFVTDLCGNDPAGLYRWERTDGSLRFTVVSDSCSARVALFTTRPWRESA